MDKPSDSVTPKPSARRKLIRGSLSLPAVLAVHNGSALAATSNQFRCANNFTELSADRKAPAPGPADGYVRVARYQDTAGKFFVKYSDVIAKAAGAGLGYTGTATKYAFGGTDYLRWSTGTGGPTTSLSMDMANLVAVEFKNAGTTAAPNYSVTGIVVEGAVPSTEKRSAISNSCWNSVN
jgi:hypothetical protein